MSLPPTVVTWLFEEDDRWSIWTHDGNYADWTLVANVYDADFPTILDNYYDRGVDFVVQYLDGSQEYHLLVKE